MGNGFIKLHRKTLGNPIVCKDSEHFFIWIYLLLEATHTGYDSMFKGERITLQPGQLITGRKSISEKTNISESKVQRVLKTFEIEQQIEQQSSNKNRLITIKNWSEYQTNEQQIEQQLNNNRTTTEQQLNTNKNVKNVNNANNVKNTIPPTPLNEPKRETLASVIKGVEDVGLRNALNDFKDFRRSNNSKFTVRALKMIINELNRLANDTTTQIAILNQSIMMGWKGVYPLKQEGGKSHEGNKPNNWITSDLSQYPIFND